MQIRNLEIAQNPVPILEQKATASSSSNQDIEKEESNQFTSEQIEYNEIEVQTIETFEPIKSFVDQGI